MSDETTTRLPDPSPTGPRSLSRRRTLVGAAGAGLALPILAACSSSGDSTATDPGAQPAGTDSSSPTGGGSSAEVLAKTSDVPVGGGEILPDAGVVVTQPTAGTFKAFSATCTHAGCPVSQISDGKILCPCHGSEFSVTDGSVLQGPATSALAEVAVTVKGGEILKG